MRFIIERKEVSPKADGSWALVTPPANVTATFLTGPNAASYQPSGIKIERMGDAPARRQVRELGNGPTDLALLASALQRAAENQPEERATEGGPTAAGSAPTALATPFV